MVNGLKKLLQVSSLSDNDIENILALSQGYLDGRTNSDLLQGKIIANLFFENSTRTLLAFEIAEKVLGATSVTLNTSLSSINKGESLSDTVATLAAMGADLMVIRAGYSGFVEEVSKIVDCCIINAGDGNHEHPTQALTDYATIRFLMKGDVRGIKVVICGDVFHSRVARSNIRLLSRYGANVQVVTPLSSSSLELEGVSLITHDIEEGIRDADVIMLLRIQKERMSGNEFISEKEYSRHYILDSARLSIAKKDAIILHPGPMNRGVEISSEVADKHASVLLQVKIGAAIRKAILHYMLG